eukprot:CAMPEP_0202004854 /NCGR_PEP_ID=MMETSP0905-20130828/10061_1 /ASSEMBLY_ACC=CAM_ASM_000554 /TAXON_ID=420261 /ORGANISM="Thalassiosira antarctica, Strain CCMP982" /LENGTH=1035 /DNA_ID=CAMNT_0048562299 /DNA_START=41 /DNA_END=3148 /DNA_ORIENTATION=+
MRQRLPSIVLSVCFFAHVGSALLASPTAIRSGAFPNPLAFAPSITTLKKSQLPFHHRASSIYLSSAISADETAQKVAADDTKHYNSHATTLSTHLKDASLAQLNNDVVTQQREMEYAEQVLVQWVEEYRGRNSHSSDSSDSLVEQPELPDAQLFNDVIEGLLALPSSFAIVDDENDNEKSPPNEDVENDTQEMNDEIRRQLLRKGKSREHLQSENNKSDRATHILDLMESFHEPTGSIYDTIIASHGEDVLQCLSYLSTGQDGDDELNSKESLYHQQAWKSAKSALQLLNRSEELYQETGQSSSQLPSIASYVTAMDVWKALAVVTEEDDEKKKRDEALEVVRNLRQRRLKVYTLDRDAAGENNNRGGSGGYNILPQEVATMTVEEVLDFTTNLLSESVPEYQLKIEDTSKIGTWHFNQLIFDLAKYPQSFSGSLAQDLLDYMVYMVKKSSPSKRRRRRLKQSAPHPNIPKPNAETINGVLKAWMVTPDYSDVARRAEAVLAKLAIWQSEGILWGVSADTISYNTCINCWKESGITGAAQRATDILRLMEDASTTITPDVISYTTCIGAWADCSSRDPSAGGCAEELLMRMYNRNKDAAGDESVAPRPTTRCFNAVLLAFANGRQSGSGKRAMELLRFMERLNSEGYADLSPDRYTFNIIMKALLCCGERGASQKANQLLERMEDSYSKGNSSMKPDLITYNTVLDAFSKEGDAKSAERLLEKMLNNRGDDMAKPNSHSYTAVLTAWSRSEDKAMSVRRAQALFDDIEGRYAAGETDFRAETSVYNALINCWAKSGDRTALYHVTQILSLMEELGLKGGDSDVQPNSRTYCSVLDTLANSKKHKAHAESLEILQRMEDYYSEGYDSVRPCARAYSIVLSTIARSRRKNKALEAQELLHRMESEYIGGNSACRPNVYSYNAVLNAAAFCGRDEREQEEAFKVACLTFDELRMSDYLQPSHVSYGTFLKAIKKLMQESDVRDNLVKGLFRKCCREGLASDFVLKEMADLSTPGLYQSLLEGVTNEYGNLPKSWSANV